MTKPTTGRQPYDGPINPGDVFIFNSGLKDEWARVRVTDVVPSADGRYIRSVTISRGGASPYGDDIWNHEDWFREAYVKGLRRPR